ncbi:hypothetical protein AVEN_158965-1 [Araneus ventricosus]|uniref:Uncharacterized protein n=1 Tax=Araneus ventricosus TaxID=182803 RepID=A0A4Y2BC48_ARAVE|nr:hypothetical protein AVEN_158965-1 [Araneus ventricosus]
MSALQALEAWRNPNLAIWELKQAFHKQLQNRFVRLNWVLAHAVIFSNERVDFYAKEATKRGKIDFQVPKSNNVLRKEIREELTLLWQDWWILSRKGRHIVPLLPSVSTIVRTLNSGVTHFLTGHVVEGSVDRLLSCSKLPRLVSAVRKMEKCWKSCCRRRLERLKLQEKLE